MNFRIVGQFLGHIALAETCVLAIPLVSSLIHRDGAASAFVFSMVICFGISALFFSSGESKKEKLTIQESIANTPSIRGLSKWATLLLYGENPPVAIVEKAWSAAIKKSRPHA